MYKIISNEEIKKDVFKLVIKTCDFKNAMPGQFAIVMSDEMSERIPLTICDYDDESVTFIYAVVGASTLVLSRMKDNIYALIGPLGNNGLILDVENEKKVLMVAGGIGIAAILPQAKFLKEKNIYVDLIYGTKCKDKLILIDEIKNYVNNIYICTDDGSYGEKGNVVDLMKEHTNYDVSLVIGPVVMMKYASIFLKSVNIPSIVSLNPIMVDGTGMCGSCRVNVDGCVKFACVDGPEFYGESVDFDNLIDRMNIYKTIEGRKYLEELEKDTHRGGCGNCE